MILLYDCVSFFFFIYQNMKKIGNTELQKRMKYYEKKDSKKNLKGINKFKYSNNNQPNIFESN